MLPSPLFLPLLQSLKCWLWRFEVCCRYISEKVKNHRQSPPFIFAPLTLIFILLSSPLHNINLADNFADTRLIRSPLPLPYPILSFEGISPNSPPPPPSIALASPNIDYRHRLEFANCSNPQTPASQSAFQRARERIYNRQRPYYPSAT